MKIIKKNILIAFTTNIFAQLLSILSNIGLASFYSPKQFGLYGLSVAVTTSLSILFSQRLDYTLLENKYKNTSRIKFNIYLNGILRLTIILLFIIILLYIILDFDAIYNFLPLNVFIVTPNLFFNSLMVKESKLQSLNVNKILFNVFLVTFSILLHLFSIENGLIIGYTLGNLLSFIFTLKLNRIKLKIVKFKFYIETYIENIYFVKNLLPASLFSEISIQFPIIFIPLIFSLDISGNFLMANRILIVPIIFFGNFLGELFRNRIIIYQNINDTRRVYFRFFYLLITLSSFFIFITMISIDSIVLLLLGKEWVNVVPIIKMFVFISFFQSIAPPLSYILIKFKIQKYDTIMQLIRMFGIIASPAFVYKFNSFELYLTLHTFFFIIYYVGNIYFQLMLFKK